MLGLHSLLFRFPVLVVIKTLSCTVFGCRRACCLGCGVVSYLVDRIRDRVDCFVGHGSNPQLAFTCASLCSVESFTATDTTDRFVAPHVVFNVDNDNVPRMFSIYRLNEQSTANGVAYNSTNVCLFSVC